MKRADAALTVPEPARMFGLDAANVARLRVPTALLITAMVGGMLLPGTWQFVAITAGVQGLLTLSSGMLFGRVGMLSLCPLTFAGVAVWVNLWFRVHQPLPFFLTVALGAVAAIPIGVLVGGLAVRLRGVNLAVVTLAFSAAVVAIFSKHKFPGALDSTTRPSRPMGFTSDRMYFLLSVLTLVAIGLALEWYGRRRDGQSWRAVRSSERATAAAGLSVPMVKLRAFVVSAAIAGVAGGLLAGQYKGSVAESSFLPVANLVIVAAAVLVGAQSLSGAVFAGLLAAFVPELFRRWGLETEYAQMLFGVGAIHALSQGGGGISAGFPWRRPRPSKKALPSEPASLARLEPPPLDAAPVLKISGLTVRYGALTALNQVDLEVPPRTVVGVIGPNGAGKTTLIDTVTGFVDSYEGTVTLEGKAIDGLNATGRARAGLRRTFQQGRAISELTVGQYINVFVPKPLPPGELQELLGFFGLPPEDEPIAFIDVGTRRIIEVAAALASRPKVAFLDEPAAGLGQEQSQELARRIKEIPDRFGCSVVLVEHNVELVASVSSKITVLDFGIVLTSGTPADVLADKRVALAYLGEELEDAEVGG